jgi:hypothetical protein
MPPRPHINHGYSCMTCRHFTFDPKRPTDHNRYCMYQGKLLIKDGHCGCWKTNRTLKDKLLRRHPVKALCR